MRIYTLILLSIFFVINSNSQDYYSRDDVTKYDLVKTIDLVNFKPVGELKNVSIKIFKTAILQPGSDNLIKQINIDGRASCSNDFNECYELWNLYYENVSKSFFKKRCIELTFLLDMDGIIKRGR